MIRRIRLYLAGSFTGCSAVIANGADQFQRSIWLLIDPSDHDVCYPNMRPFDVFERVGAFFGGERATLGNFNGPFRVAGLLASGPIQSNCSNAQPDCGHGKNAGEHHEPKREVCDRVVNRSFPEALFRLSGALFLGG